MLRSLLRRLVRLAGWLLVVALFSLCVFTPLYVFNDSLPTPVRGFFYDAFFDLNLMTVRELWDAARHDPSLHDLLLERTRTAYLKGGWTDATEAAKAVMGQNVMVYADDRHIVYWARANLAIAVRLAADSPERCKRYLFTSSNDADFDIAKDEAARANDAFWAAVADGTRRRREGVKWIRPTWEMAVAWWVWTMQGPDRLSIEELAAMRAEKRAPAAMLCKAEMRRERNVLIQPDADAARLLRIELAWWREGDRSFRAYPVVTHTHYM